MIRLEKFGEEDFEQLIKWIDSEALMINWSGFLFRFPLSKESLKWYIDDTNDLQESDAFVYKAIDEESNQVIGHISLGGISRKNKSARISRVLVGDTAEKNKGYCRQMINAVLKIGFETLKLHRITLGVYDDNVSAFKCYERSGFVTEGIFRDVLFQEGKYRSMIEMSMLESEWKNIHLC
ncbi:MAG: GNAT family protein [Ferruginibacter sp.]